MSPGKSRQAIRDAQEQAFGVMAERELVELRGIAHARCKDHVRVEGYRELVCVLAGQTRDEVVADALELLG